MLILVHFFVLRLPIELALVVIVINCLLNSLISMYVIIFLVVDTDFSSLARFKAALKHIDLSKFLTYCID